MTRAHFYAELETLLEQEAGTITGSEALADLGGWDSIAVLSFIALVDSKLNEMVAPVELAKCKTVEDLVSLLHGKVE